MSARLLALSAITIAATAAIAGAGSNAISNLGVPGFRGSIEGHRAAFAVSEWSVGADLNGDGDQWDYVAHVHDRKTGATTNLGLAAFNISHDGRHFAFGVSELSQGAQDLNGDGDTFDQVLHVYDAQTGSTINSGVAFSGFARVGDGQVAVEANERGSGNTDMNGDGDVFDLVLNTIDGSTGVVTNHGISANAVKNEGGRFSFAAFESAQGMTDLNGDGDTIDSVVHVYDAARGTVRNTGLAGVANGFTSNDAIVRVTELGQGVDLNGDGDMSDQVPMLFKLSNGQMRNVGVAVSGLLHSGNLLVLSASESGEATDLNGDGDLWDSVVQIYDAASGRRTDLGLPAYAFAMAVQGQRVGFAVSEYAHGATDLNGDGDVYDQVVHVYDATAGTLTNLGLGGQLAGFAGDHLFFSVHESGTDMNGDGDATDSVVFSHEFPASRTVNHRLAGGGFALGDGFAAFSVVEAQQGGTDLNGDGDTLDRVVHILATQPGRVTNTGLAGAVSGHTNPSKHLVLFDVTEFGQGVDLNGDGDLFDLVTHAASLPVR